MRQTLLHCAALLFSTIFLMMPSYAQQALYAAPVVDTSAQIDALRNSIKQREETLEIRSLNNARALRGRKGKAADLGFKPAAVARVE